MSARAAILGCLGPDLDADEARFLREADPWGFILFARNVDTPDRLRRLTAGLRDAVGRDAPVFIDQEGGRVARLRPPHWRAWEPVGRFLARCRSEAAAMEALWLRHRLIATELRAVGIDANCLPLVDVPGPGVHPIIGERVLAADPLHIALHGREVAAGLIAGGVLPVVKHVPGHGRTTADSHDALPVVAAPLALLRETDFLPFRALRDLPMAMTAHVVYTALDPGRCATLSPPVIAAIRGEIGFDGLLMTDDLSMGAVGGPFGERARAALAAGCDAILHCNGDRAEIAALLAETPRLAGKAAARAARALGFRQAPGTFDAEVALARLAELTAERADA